MHPIQSTDDDVDDSDSDNNMLTMDLDEIDGDRDDDDDDNDNSGVGGGDVDVDVDVDADAEDRDNSNGDSTLQNHITSQTNDHLSNDNKNKISDFLVQKIGVGFICTVCHKKFKLLKVAEVHHKHPVQCEYCRKIFCNSIVLGKHMWKMHQFNGDAPIEKYNCTMCKKKFHNKDEYEQHEYAHVITNNTTDFTYCEICDINISNKAVYSRHIQKHQKEVYKCTICYKGFISAHLLENHIARLCDTVIAHKCRICSKTIISALYFRYHMNKHTGEKPYRCTICNESFMMPCLKHRKHRKRRCTGDAWTSK